MSKDSTYAVFVYKLVPREVVLGWPIVPNTWLVKIGTNLMKEEVLALEKVVFQLQHREAFSPCRRLST